MVKVVPPKSWKPRKDTYNEALSNLLIKNPIEQNPEGKMGVYEFKHITLPSLLFSEFIKQYQNREQVLNGLSVDQIELLFWKTLPYFSPVYGADLLGTLMDESAGSWSLNHLDTVLQKGLSENIRGVNSSYCYIGTWKSLFCWHKEDLDLDAINYLHLGKSKFWYCIQKDDSIILENEAKKNFFEGFDKCSEHLRHKTCLINPYQLKKAHNKLRITKIEQKPNEFIIAFSGAYHCGFNFGINVAQAVNFATLDWIKKLRNIKYCRCKKSSVKINPFSVVSQLLNYEQFKSNEEILKIKQELQSQNIEVEQFQKVQKKVNLAQKNKKTKIIQKKQKSVKKDKPKHKPSIKKSELIEYTTAIQCDLCQRWHDLSMENQQLTKKPEFCCFFIGKQCQPLIEEREEY